MPPQDKPEKASPLVDHDSSLNGLGKKCIFAHFFCSEDRFPSEAAI